MAAPLHVQLLAVHGPDRSPSQRYRVEQFLPAWREQGVTLDYAGALGPGEADLFYGQTPARTKARVALRALARRAWSVRPRRHAPDVVLVQREAFFLGNDWSERLASLRAPLVFDFDDAIWMHAVSAANRRFAFLKNVSKISDLVRRSHTVIAGNAWLADWARQHNPHVVVIPTCVDTTRFVPAPRPDDGTVVIGWSGSASTVAHLRLALPVLRRVRARFGDRVRFKVMGDPTFRDEGLGVVGEAWSSDREVPALQAMDIGLMPLPDDDWAKGKCGLKGLTYMAVGIPAVMAAVGVNTELVQDGVDGFTPRTDDEWFARLCQLVEDSALRERLGAAGRRTVEARYSVARWQGPLLDVLRTAAASR